MRPTKIAPLLVYYSLLALIGAAWLFLGAEFNRILFYSLFVVGFSFLAYCGFLDEKRGSVSRKG